MKTAPTESLWSTQDIARLATALSRRKLMTASFATAILAGLNRVSAQTPTADGTWSFLDDKGNQITTDAQPTRVAADLIAAAALWDFGVRPTAVFGWDVNPDDTFNVAAGAVVRDEVEIVGNATTPFDIERAFAAAPDLIVTLDGDPADPASYWSIDAEIVENVRRVAPILAINSNAVRTDLVVGRFAELSAALGADLASDDLVSLRTEAETAAADLEVGIKANRGVRCLFVYPSEDNLYVANPRVVSDLIYLREFGLEMPDLDVADTEYWEFLSWEESAKYPVDLIFTTTRAPISADDLKAHPVFGQLPAVQAGQLVAWNDTHTISYQGLATLLTETLAAVSSAQIVAG